MVCGVKSLPLYAGQHNAGKMRHHQATAIALTGYENLPRFHGPGLKRLRPKNSFNATGAQNAVY